VSNEIFIKLQTIMAAQKLSKNNNKQGRSSQFGGVSSLSDGSKKSRRKVYSVSQILARVRKQKQRKLDQKKRKKPIKPIIPPKSLLIILKEKPEKAVYNRRIIDYKHCGLLQRYIGLGGKILPRRQTKLSAKQQRYVAKTIKSARIMGLLPFVSKERGFFR
jgi:small subunit ribosomal protein S18